MTNKHNSRALDTYHTQIGKYQNLINSMIIYRAWLAFVVALPGY